MTDTLSRKDALRIFAVAGAGFSLGLDITMPGTPAAAATATDFSPLVC